MEDKKKKVKSFTLSPNVIEAIKLKSLKDQRSESQVVNIILEKMLTEKDQPVGDSENQLDLLKG